MRNQLTLILLLLLCYSSFSQKFVIEDEVSIREKYRKIMYEDKANLYDSLIELLKQIKNIKSNSEATNGLFLTLTRYATNDYPTKNKSYEIGYKYLYGENNKFVEYEWEQDLQGKKLRFLRIEGWTTPEIIGEKTFKDLGIESENDAEDDHLSIKFNDYKKHYPSFIALYKDNYREKYNDITNEKLGNDSYANKFLEYFLNYYNGEQCDNCSSKDWDDRENATKANWEALLLSEGKKVQESKFRGKSFYFAKSFMLAQLELQKSLELNPNDIEIKNYLIATKNDILREKFINENQKFIYPNFPNGWSRMTYKPNKRDPTMSILYDINQDGFLDEIAILKPSMNNKTEKFPALFIFLNNKKGSLLSSQKISVSNCQLLSKEHNDVMFGALFDNYYKPEGGVIVGLTFKPNRPEFYRYITNLLKWNPSKNSVVTEFIDPYSNFNY